MLTTQSKGKTAALMAVSKVKETITSAFVSLKEDAKLAYCWADSYAARFWSKRNDKTHLEKRRHSGQGTTEYAILVGVLVVIAIIAITAFRPRIEELWNAITEGINGL